MHLAPQKGCPLMQMSLSWLGSGRDVKEPLRNLEEAATIVKTLCGSPAIAAFSGVF